MSDKWTRFDESDKDDRKHMSPTPEGCTAWAIIWDADPQMYFYTNPGTWGGSGWYANPVDVISKPKIK